jgi:hypothetical protein
VAWIGDAFAGLLAAIGCVVLYGGVGILVAVVPLIWAVLWLLMSVTTSAWELPNEGVHRTDTARE